MSRKQEQLASAIRRAVQTVIAEGLNDPRVSGLISVTEVRVSSDGQEATVMLSVLPEDRQTLVLHGVRHAAEHVRREAGDRIRIGRMPRLNFRLDTTLKKQAEVLRALHEARDEGGPAEEPIGDDEP